MTVRVTANDQTRATATTKTKAKLVPELIQSLQILVMPVAELKSYVLETAERNPMLEINFDNDLFRLEAMPQEISSGDSSDEVADTSDTDSIPANHSRRERSIAGSTEWDFSRIQDDYLENETLQAYLHLQASELHLDEMPMKIMEALIECVNDDGYFDSTLDRVSCDLGVEIEDVEPLYEQLRSFRPAGVGAMDLSECLVAQVSEYEPHYELIVRILRDDLDAFVHGYRNAKMTQHFGAFRNELAEALAVIQTLNPRPGSAFFQKNVSEYIIPDIIITEENGNFEASVLGADTPCLSISKDYVDMMHNSHLGDEDRKYLESCSQEANLIMHNLISRNEMLESFAALLLRKQARFFLTEGKVLAPMTMQMIADELGVHVSTVSRATNGKYLQAPWGCIPLKSLFSRAIQQNAVTGEKQISSADVKSAISSLIASESPQSPLSDQQICDILNRRGIEIKRRTVAKYRIALGFDSQSGRRKVTAADTEDQA